MKLRILLYTAMMAALTAVGAFIRIPFGASSFTLQFLFTAMAGLLLGAKYGALSQLVYVVLGIVGLPVFTMGGGVGYVFQPTFGFLLGLIPAAWIIGKLGQGKRSRIAIACGMGLVALYAVGVPYMALILNGYMGKGMDARSILWEAVLPFLPFDVCKVAVIAWLCPVLRRRMKLL